MGSFPGFLSKSWRCVFLKQFVEGPMTSSTDTGSPGAQMLWPSRAHEWWALSCFPPVQANPPCLLSTVQYISSFYASCLSGEESYWWMQFTAAVEFIKTIDDRKWPRPGPPRHHTVARRQCSSYFESWRLFCLICTASRCFHVALPKQINKLTRWFSFLSAFLSCIFYFLSPNRE